MTNESAKVSMGSLDSKSIHLNDTDAGHYQSGNDRRHNAAFDSGMSGWCCLVVTPPCGYCLKASMMAGFAKVLVRGYYFWYCKSMFMENEAI